MHMQSWIFDVDGVILNPQERKVTRPKIIDEILERLARQDSVAIITGRSLPKLQQEVISLIEAHEAHPNFLDKLYIAGEFGGVYATYNVGRQEQNMHQESVLPTSLVTQLRQVTQPFLDCVYIEDKKVVFSVESLAEKIELFNQKKEALIRAYEQLIQESNLSETVEVLPDRIAVNVRSKYANKYRATELYLDWLETKNYIPEAYTVFGDSASDLEMGQALNDHSLSFTFVYTGNKEEIATRTNTFPIIFTEKLCDEGTQEYLLAH